MLHQKSFQMHGSEIVGIYTIRMLSSGNATNFISSQYLVYTTAIVVVITIARLTIRKILTSEGTMGNGLERELITD